MKNGIERRRHPRLPLTLPVVLETSQGAIKGITVNISVSGFSVIMFSVTPDIRDEFKFSLKSFAGHEVLVTCENLWSRNIIANKNTYSGIGVRFTKISPGDRDILSWKLNTLK